jgi:hypothetical protein
VTFQNLSLHLVRNKEEMDVCNGRGREHEGKQRTTSLLISLHAWLQSSLIYRLNKKVKTRVQRDKLKVNNMVVWVEEWLDQRDGLLLQWWLVIVEDLLMQRWWDCCRLVDADEWLTCCWGLSSNTPQFKPLAAKAATISLSAFGLGGPFGFVNFSEKWKKQKKSEPSSKREPSSEVDLHPFA